MNNSAFELSMKEAALKTERYIESTFERDDADLCEADEAMKYSLFAGGKRIRPYLVLAFCRLFGGKEESALPFAAAIEMIHTFSLIHDDLPCMDDDELRRGKPTCHKVYGEATAVLAGDALALRAFGTAAANPYVGAQDAVRAVILLSHASAERGMVGGQIMDMYGETHALSLEKLKKLQGLKTGALIRASALLGAIAAGVPDGDPRMKAAEDYADGIGLAFQITDDILDVTGDETALGKSIGSDAANGKDTFVTHMSISDAANYAKEVTEQAKSAISAYPGNEELLALADSLLTRKS